MLHTQWVKIGSDQKKYDCSSQNKPIKRNSSSTIIDQDIYHYINFTPEILIHARSAAIQESLKFSCEKQKNQAINHPLLFSFAIGSFFRLGKKGRLADN